MIYAKPSNGKSRDASQLLDFASNGRASTSRQSRSPLHQSRTSAARLSALSARRAFSTSRAQFSSPYHYPEGPRSNLPFNPLTRFFFLRYWGFMAVGFGLPFGIAYWQMHKNQ